jgi:hypothetical protein
MSKIVGWDDDREEGFMINFFFVCTFAIRILEL